LCDTGGYNPVRRSIGYFFTFKQNLAVPGANLTRDRSESSRFAGAVATNQCDDFSRLDIQ
jgi:hypothetical protein